MSDGDKSEETLESKARPPNGGRLSASDAHEINNPLDSLLNLLYLLESEPLTENGRRHLALAEEEVRRVSQIARDTLRKDKAVPVPELINVGHLLTAVLEFYQQRFDSSGIMVQTERSDDDSIPVYAGALRQVFSNLLLNAVDAMPDGGRIQIRVHAGHEWLGQQRQGVRVTVADNGCGIPSTILPLIFQQAFTMKPDGHGMGLSFVKATIQNHRGFVRVRSSTQPERHGTVFSFFLPAA